MIDCPACGRSLQVPATDGLAAIPEPIPNRSPDNGFLNALEELSHLNSPQLSEQSRPLMQGSPLARKNPLKADSNDVSQGRNSMRIVPWSTAATSTDSTNSEDDFRQLAAIPPDEDGVPSIVPELLEPEAILEPNSDEQQAAGMAEASGQQSATLVLPLHFSSALEELSGKHSLFETPEGLRPVADRTASGSHWLLVSFLASTVAFVVGYSVADWQASMTSVVSNRGEENRTDDRDKPATEVMADAVHVVIGKVQYLDESGKEKPDSGALLLLVPTENTAELKLDAKPLRDSEPTVAKSAVSAALKALNASVTRAGSDGEFRLERLDSGPMKVVVISRHAIRADSESVDPVAAKTLADWFDSPTQLTGRLQVLEKSLSGNGDSAAEPLEITFSKP